MKERLLFPEWPEGGVDRPTVCEEKSLARQSEQQESDINFIMKRFEKTGVLPPDTREAVFTDVSSIGSYREVLEVIQRAQEGFMALPPSVREKFGNDPVQLMDFAADPAHLPELEELGIVEKTAKPVEPAPAEPAKA